MLPSSVRRVAAAAPHSTLPRTTATTFTRSYIPTQRRRYSSSKPSRDSGSEDPSVRQSVQPSAEAKTSETKASGEKRKRKAKDASDKLKYPSVPTTAHIPSDFLALSSFFSLHRPISVTRGLPRNVTEDAFASIFNTPTRSQKAAEVMSTLSRTVQDLEQPMAGLSLQQAAAVAEADAESESSSSSSHHHHHQQQQQHEALQNIGMRNADGSEASISVQINNMAGQFLPFRPPPLPQAETPASKKADAEAAEAAAAAAEANSLVEEDVSTRVYKAVFTIEETTDGNGEVKIVAHSPELIEDPESASGPGAGRAAPHGATMTISVDGVPEDTTAPRSFLERMALRQLQFEESRSKRPAWWAISVKRQRKLKMNKKKYKKLQKRLRHERLKVGRT